ncbi:MAG: response regulator [Victivallaceae bacterium]|nr:response regulator [Victivallaceae bacterium]MDD4181967.1 response regulator [Victivallaceae bacterium]
MQSSRRVLIVDDQSDLREQLAQLLLSSGRQNKTARLVKSMRARLMGFSDGAEKDHDALPNYDIDTAGQGQEAYEMVQAALNQNAPYAVMFLDMRMPPGWDGLKTAQEIRKIDQNIEIVMMTAYADYSQEDLAREISSPEKMLFIKKPFHSEEICQFAYSLCMKWNNQMLESARQNWLGKLILNLRKIKQQDTAKDSYRRILDAYLGFLATDKGFVADWLAETAKWNIHAFSGFDKEEDALELLIKNQSQILDTTAQSIVDTLNVIPLREQGVNSFIVAKNAKTSNDQTWFHCINMLNLTALDQLAFIRKLELRLQNCPASSTLDEIRIIIKGLKSKYLGDPDIAKLSARLNDISY